MELSELLPILVPALTISRLIRSMHTDQFNIIPPVDDALRRADLGRPSMGACLITGWAARHKISQATSFSRPGAD